MKVEVAVEKLGYQMTARVHLIGKDVLIELTGGSHPHIGTVATYCKATGDKETTRFPSHSGRFHKDDVLADVLLEEIAELLPQNCTITAGVHVDGISQEQIAASFGMARQLGQKIAAWLRDLPIDMEDPTYYTKKTD